MTVRFSTVVVDSGDPALLSRFWCAVLGWRVIGTEDDGSIEIGPAAPPGTTLLFQPIAEGKHGKNRLHLDLNPSGADQEVELGRLRAIGARHVDIGQSGDETWVVLADPEGNEFCLLQRRVDE